MKRLWFKAKEYGWGWYPIAWQGWAVTLGYVALLIGINLLVQHYLFSVRRIFSTLIVLDSALTVLLIKICYRTGEPPRWRWGK
jgi:hypothetical protein